ncbi:hypothetical protein [Lysobacter sp. cf310]|uniref:hypothetical protein n=1 Tax=Lysobacter sp. cf310 TaxID=1761790 RepID=UPI0008F2C0B7|nr:hypothetical protein [Lysobacter sp. cf310]SFL27851.1 hypothetical protein SAMN04487938_3985 [Lysobacter sp. cf310]
MNRARDKKNRRAHEGETRADSFPNGVGPDVSREKSRARVGACSDEPEAGAAVATKHDGKAALAPAASPLAGANDETESAVRLRDLSACLAHRYKEIELLTGLLAASEGERDELKGKCDATTSQLLTMQHERNCLAAELSRTQAERMELASALESRDTTLRTITSSHSWRMTWPMRKLRRWVTG